jgi:Nucleoside-diphosphate-sugar epimerases
MRCLFITGATGFLGGAVICKVLQSPHQWDRILFLVRGETPAVALTRLKSNLDSFELNTELKNKITENDIILGDLKTPELFLDDERLNLVTHVINCAAVASFSNNPLIQPVNVDGTFALAKKMASVPNIQRFLQVGTAMACGPEKGMVVPENYKPKGKVHHFVKYTASKAEIEAKIRQELPNLPFVAARPSIVVGHTKLGCKPSGSIFWVFRMALMLRQFTCSLADKIDIIPVDYCADVLVALIERETLPYDFYHISAGTDAASSFAEIDTAIANALGTAPVGADYKQVSFEEIAERAHEFSTIFGHCNKRLMLKAIRLYGEFAALNVLFENYRLHELGLPQPVKFKEYAGVCVATSKDIPVPKQMMVDFK